MKQYKVLPIIEDEIKQNKTNILFFFFFFNFIFISDNFFISLPLEMYGLWCEAFL